MIAGAAPLELLDVVADEILHAANDDGATAAPLMHEEAVNLAGYVVELVGPLADSILDQHYARGHFS